MRTRRTSVAPSSGLVARLGEEGRLWPFLERQPRWAWALLAGALLTVVGVTDYFTGYEFSAEVFYLLGVGCAAWFIGRTAGFALAVASALVYLAADQAAGAHYTHPLAPCWNACVLLVFLSAVVWLLARLQAVYKSLEARVHERTLALQEEMAQRADLEKKLLEISEREQSRIGRDLHDGVCQHLTGTALACQVLTERLEEQGSPEAEEAGQVAALIEEGIAQVRQVARGLHPVEQEAEGFQSALQELAAQTARQHGVACQCECATPVLVHDAARATHLFFIAQEAVRNALHHGHARHIRLVLTSTADRVQLRVEDDGQGLPADFLQRHGLGIRIMEYRAAMVAGTLGIHAGAQGGTVVTCTFPQDREPGSEETHD